MRISIRHRDEVIAIIQRRLRRVEQSSELQILLFEDYVDHVTEDLTGQFVEGRTRQISVQADIDQKRIDALTEHYGVPQVELEAID